MQHVSGCPSKHGQMDHKKIYVCNNTIDHDKTEYNKTLGILMGHTVTINKYYQRHWSAAIVQTDDNLMSISIYKALEVHKINIDPDVCNSSLDIPILCSTMAISMKYVCGVGVLKGIPELISL